MVTVLFCMMFLGLCLIMLRDPHDQEEDDFDQVIDVQANIYDQEEIIEGCTVQILTNSITGETSVGWWKGSEDDMPGKDGQDGKDL